MKNDECINILAGNNKSKFQYFEGFLRTETDLFGNDVTLVSDEITSSFITYHEKLGIYTFKDLSEVLTKNSEHGFDGFILNLMIKL